MDASSPRAVATKMGTSLTVRTIRIISLPSMSGRPRVEDDTLRTVLHDRVKTTHRRRRAGHDMAESDAGPDQRATELGVIVHEKEVGHADHASAPPAPRPCPCGPWAAATTEQGQPRAQDSLHVTRDRR